MHSRETFASLRGVLQRSGRPNLNAGAGHRYDGPEGNKLRGKRTE